MSWRLVNRFLLWAPAAACAFYASIGTLVGVAAQTPNKVAQHLVDNQVTMWVAIGVAPYLVYWLFGIPVLWVAAFLWTDQKAKEREAASRPFAHLEALAPFLKPLGSAGPPLSDAVSTPGTQELHPPLFVNEQRFFTPTVELVDPALSPTPITGRLEATEEADTVAAPGLVDLHGLYVGNIIIAAGALGTGHWLEIAIIGFNGTGETIQLSDISGRIRAGTGNLRDMVKLPAPVMQGIFKAAPGAEFFMALRQDVSPTQAEEYLAALNANKNLSLDLREWRVTVASATNPDKSAALPLWDGVNLRRRDDIVSNRNTILSVGVAVGTSGAIGVGEAVTKEKPDGE